MNSSPEFLHLLKQDIFVPNIITNLSCFHINSIGSDKLLDVLLSNLAHISEDIISVLDMSDIQICL